MKNLTAISKLLMVAGLMVVFAEKPAHAYLDAGTGSMVIQLLLAGTAGAAVLGKILWQRLLAFFRVGSLDQTSAE